MRRICFLILALVFTTTAIAETKISLVTVSPGSVIFESFGHTALIVEDSQRPEVVTVYQYGAADVRGVFRIRKAAKGIKLDGLYSLLTSTLPARVDKDTARIKQPGELPETLQARYLDPQYRRGDLLRKLNLKREQRAKLFQIQDLSIARSTQTLIQELALDAAQTNALKELADQQEPARSWLIISELSLTEEQALNFLKLIDADLAKGSYAYENFANNCATKVRDHLFDESVLGAEARKALVSSAISVSFQDIAMSSIDAGAALSPSGKVRLIPATMGDNSQASMMLGMLGLPATEFSSAKELYAALAEAGKNLNTNKSLEYFVEADSLNGIRTAFHEYFFGAKLTTKPITLDQALFIPNNLRMALLPLESRESTGVAEVDAAFSSLETIINPKTGKPVIVSERKFAPQQ